MNWKLRSTFLNFLVAIFSAVLIFVGRQNVYAQNEIDTPTLFFRQNCMQCESVLESVEEANYQNIQILYLEDPSVEDIYNEIAKTCSLYGQPVPMLYANGECTVGEEEVIAMLEEVGEGGSNSGGSTQTEQDEQNVATEQDGTGTDQPDEDSVEQRQKQVSGLVLLASLIAPILFVGIAYFLVTRLKL